MRSYGKLWTAIWRDSDFTSLPRDVQRVYLILISQPDVSLCGVLPYAPRRWAGFAQDSTVKDIQAACRRLENDRYIVIDEATEEVVIRSFVKHDVAGNGKLLIVGAKNQFQGIHSHRIRGALGHWYSQIFAELEDPVDPFAEGVCQGVSEGVSEGVFANGETPSGNQQLVTSILQPASSLAPQKPRRERNEQWDALEDVFGYRPTGAEAKLWGRITKDLAEWGAIQPTITECVRRYRLTYPDADLTPTALQKHYQRLMSPTWHAPNGRAQNAGERALRQAGLTFGDAT